MSKKLLGSDLDGTLFYPKHRIRMLSRKTVKLIQDFIDEGNEFVVVSGRNHLSCLKVSEKIKRPIGIVGCNGAVIYHHDKCIQNKTIDPKTAHEVLDYLEKNWQPKGYYVMTNEDEFILKNSFKSLGYKIGQFLWYIYQGVLREPYYTSEKKFYEAIDNGKVNKIMVMFGITEKSKQRSNEANKDLREKFGDVIEPSWSYEFIELSPAGTSKSSGLKSLANYLNITSSDIYVVGDSGNDISMFKEFSKNSFCMAKAPLSVSKYANHTIKHFDEIREYLEERK